MNNPTESLERIARAIFYYGYDSLSEAENFVLRTDEEARHFVYAEISRLKRNRLLEVISPSVPKEDYCPQFPSENYLLEHSIVTCENQQIARIGELWFNNKTRIAVVEIKEWNIHHFHTATNQGSHSVIFQKNIGSIDDDNLLDTYKTILKQHGFGKKGFNAIDRKKINSDIIFESSKNY